MESIPPQTIPARLIWTDLSGTILPGGYELKELIEADGETARFHVRVLGDRELDTVAQLLQVSSEETARLASAWETIRELRHRNLTVPLGSGIWEREGHELVYVITRRADESLDVVLRERALTAAEAKDVLLSVSAGLEALHVNGLVHGCLSPEQVLAVGDAIQLPVTCIRLAGQEPETPLVNPKYVAPESLDAEGEDGENLTPESDIWCLGATLFEALTQKDWSEESREELVSLPEPFATITLRCLEEGPGARAKLPEIVALLRGEIKPAPRTRAAAATTGPSPVSLAPAPAPTTAAPQTAEAQKVVSPAAAPPQRPLGSRPVDVEKGSPASSARMRSSPNGQAAAPAEVPPPKPSVVRAGNAPAAPASFATAANRIWVWIGIAVVFVMGLFWALRPKSQAPRAAIATAPAPKSSVQPQKTATTPPAAQTKVLQPDGTAASKPEPRASEANPAPAVPQAAQPSTPAASPRVRKTRNGDIWRVILYTYARQEDAQRMSDSINKRHPDLHTEVFAPDSDGPYLVTVSGGNERPQAEQVRRRALSAGMPRDSYVQNYSR